MSHSVNNQNSHDDDYELVIDPKHHVTVLDSDHEDVEWDDCDFEVKQKTSDPKPAASIPSSSSKNNNNKNSAKKQNSQENARMKFAAAIKFLEPEIKSCKTLSG